MTQDSNKQKRQVYKKMLWIAAAAGIISGLLFLVDNSRELPRNADGMSSVRRNSPGNGKRQEELRVYSGKKEDTVTVEIAEEQYTREELQKEFEKAAQTLEKLVLGENKTLDEVRGNLNLVSEIPDTGIRVQWELDNYEVMNLQGEIQEEALTESGVLLMLNAFLSYGEEKAQHTFYAHLYPPEKSSIEKWEQELKTELLRLDDESKEQSSMPLPSKLRGETVIWKYELELRAVSILLLGVALALFVYVSEEQKKKEAQKKRLRQMELDYPQILNRFTLYLNAGMTARKAWIKLAEEYEKGEKAKQKRAVYEEIVYTMHEIQNGTSEKECYEHFGERCGLSVYRKFGTLLSQNLKKGTKGLADILKQEAENGFEERKSLAKKLGEEAGTKMLIPMFLMLGVVLVMIVVPAFFSMQL